MATPYPPILPSQARSRRSGAVGGINSATNFRIAFTRPRTLTFDQIGHVQVLIRRQLNLVSWAAQASTATFSPDREVIYLTPAEAGLAADQMNFIGIPGGALRLGGFSAGESIESIDATTEGQMYIIQIRFGTSRLWRDGGPQSTFGPWRDGEIQNRRFGEWSNTQRMFVYRAPTAAQDPIISFDIENSFLASFSWQYRPISHDPLAYARLSIRYRVPDTQGDFQKNVNVPFESTNVDGQWGAHGRVDLNIARLTVVQFTLTLTTVNNTVLPDPAPAVAHSISIFPTILSTISGTDDYGSFFRGSITPTPLLGEELDDGSIVMDIRWGEDVGIRTAGAENVPPPRDVHIYRVNTYTLEGLLIDRILAPESIMIEDFEEEDSPPAPPAHVTRDFSIEMGQEYAYLAIRDPMNSAYQALNIPVIIHMPPITPPAPALNRGLANLRNTSWRPQNYMGTMRNMNFNANSFLTTKLQQLRLSGNVSVRNLNRTTSDQITQTIGSKYPFYSRPGNMNYRVMTINALISLELDPTRTFLNLVNPAVREEGFWNSDLRLRRGYRDIGNERTYNEEVRIRRDDLFTQEGRSRSMQRVADNENPGRHVISPLRQDPSVAPLPLPPISGLGEQEGRPALDGPVVTRGPRAIYGDNLGRQVDFLTESDPSRFIFAERKFRESVMEWLSDGNPKLFRSETEGNMIVMLTAISFTPLRADRKVYSFSATLTEIAEYNLHNLLLYDLIPNDFSGMFAETPEFLADRQDPRVVNSLPYLFIPGAVDPDINDTDWRRD